MKIAKSIIKINNINIKNSISWNKKVKS
jgi:hypothetical protein